MMNRFPSSGILPSYREATPPRSSFEFASRSRQSRRWWCRIGFTLGVAASVVAIAAWRWHAEYVPIYEGRFELLLDGSAVPEGALPVVPQTLTSGGDRATAIALLERSKLLSEALSQLKRPELAPQNWPEGLSLDRIDQTQIVEVRYRNRDPEVVLAMLDALAQTYLQSDRSARQTQWEQLFAYVESQLTQLQAQKEQQQGELQAFQTRYAIDPEIQVPQVLERLSKLTEDRSQTQRQLTEAQTLPSH
ncbi:hypothetical protein IQ235_07265 [Oscillatoriales cyanobacterium LEGE 11467]|uniref:Polysaccharide chain length determinant N-terminal domain-containing protein n=1 Tax=Zarconia navalis LEGE 11467 TaxID=1828826 RepID=A0A928Z8I5_9CYAN|nr:hypothetical protein [Zarconia navalis]MBE9040584.1 hypothetical protein [Zarconia navalis LEGE 11467]